MTDPSSFAAPLIEIQPGRGRPVLLSVPHSGRDYDPDLLARTRLGRASLERLEDPLVDQLIEGAIDRGFGTVIARAPRALIDLNRAEDDLDPATIVGRTGTAPTARAGAGLGLLPSRLAGVGTLWRAPLSEDELAARIASVHRPYHAALAAALKWLAASWGEVILIDCHSMPSRPRGGANVVIGDRHGTSAAPWVSEAAGRIASRLGFAVAHNAPFAGGHIIARHGMPQRGVHAIQIEVDRAAYCQRDGRTAGPGFDRVAMLFEALSVELAGKIEHKAAACAAE